MNNFFNFNKKLAHNIQIKKIFEELQKEKRYININRRLEPHTTFQDFYSTPFFNDRIYYDPNMVGVNDDTIRFFLLHEEGHHFKGHCGYYKRITFLLIGGLLLFLEYIFISISHLDLLPLIILLGIGAFFVFWFSKVLSEKSLKKDEYISDIYAATILRDNYSKNKPSEILKNGFIEVNRYFDRKGKKHDCFIKDIWYYISEYHPTYQERIENIKNNVDIK